MLQSAYHVVVNYDGKMNYVVTSLNKVKVYTEESVECLVNSEKNPNPVKVILKCIIEKKNSIRNIVKRKFDNVISNKRGFGFTRMELKMSPEPIFVNILVGDDPKSFYSEDVSSDVGSIDSIDEYLPV